MDAPCTHIVAASAPVPVPAARPNSAQRANTRLAGALWRLTKPGLAAFSVLSAMAAYATAGVATSALQTVVAVIGITLAAGGALSLNQWWESRLDSRMERTRRRPVPAGEISSAGALTWSLLLSYTGVILLLFLVNAAAAALAAATILLYGVVYTPLKRRTRWATEIGSLSGALPPLLGAAAAGNLWSLPAWVLAVLLLFWQMPHFYGIGWMYRDDYRAASFRLLPAIDADGSRTARWALGYTAAFAVLAVLPWQLGWFGAAYGIPASIAALAMLVQAWRFLRPANGAARAARPLFLTSVMILPPLMTALVIDRWMV